MYQGDYFITEGTIFQEIVERTTGYDINQQTLVEGNVKILNNILSWSTLFWMYISQQQRYYINANKAYVYGICKVIGKAGDS